MPAPRGIELRTAAQQEQFAREAASQARLGAGHATTRLRPRNVELGHGDIARQARLQHQAGRAASAACRYDAAEFHFREAIALRSAAGNRALGYMAPIDLISTPGQAGSAGRAQ
jgi:hypothetical protein